MSVMAKARISQSVLPDSTGIAPFQRKARKT
jgi:hypothetical protein